MPYLSLAQSSPPALLSPFSLYGMETDNVLRPESQGGAGVPRLPDHPSPSPSMGLNSPKGNESDPLGCPLSEDRKGCWRSCWGGSILLPVSFSLARRPLGGGEAGGPEG